MTRRLIAPPEDKYAEKAHHDVREPQERQASKANSVRKLLIFFGFGMIGAIEKSVRSLSVTG